MAQKGLLPNFDFGREFSVAIEFSCPVSRQWPSVAIGFGLGWAFLGRDKAFWVCVPTWSTGCRWLR